MRVGHCVAGIKNKGCSREVAHSCPDAYVELCSMDVLRDLESCHPRLTLTLDTVGHVKGEAGGGCGLQRGHAGLQGPL